MLENKLLWHYNVAMANIKLHLDHYLSYFANNQRIVIVSGNTVYECINDFVSRFPELRKVIGIEPSSSIINVYLEKEETAVENFARPVKEGDDLYLMFISGG